MSKMLEAWEKFCATETAGPTGNFEFDLFYTGYQASIAAIREGGPWLYVLVDRNGMNVETDTGHPYCWPEKKAGYQSDYDSGCVDVPLYKLPDDLL